MKPAKLKICKIQSFFHTTSTSTSNVVLFVPSTSEYIYTIMFGLQSKDWIYGQIDRTINIGIQKRNLKKKFV